MAAEGIVWMVRQPPPTPGGASRMFALRQREGIMESQIDQPATVAPPVELYSGLAEATVSEFEEPYS